MSGRPILSIELDKETFLQYYYLKEELITFCRENGLSTTGGKQDITKRVAFFLSTGEKLINQRIKRKSSGINSNKLSLESVICWNFKKELAGHNKYERTDLSAINEERSISEIHKS